MRQLIIELVSLKITWAGSCKNVNYVICEQQRCRSTCAFAHSDQHHVVSFLDSMICIHVISKVQDSAEQAGLNLTWSKISKDKFSCDKAQMVLGMFSTDRT